MKKVKLNKQYIIDRTTINIKTNCWEWNLYRNKDGYGQLKNKGTHLNAHRVSYSIFNGYFDNNLFVCHKCDNPSCCNPEHLFIGTAKDNSDDKRNKGRGVKPEVQWGNNYSGKKVIAGGKTFKNYCEAGRYFGISDNGIRKRIKLGWEGYSLA